MKKLSNKQKIIFILSLIFFFTSVAVKIKNFNDNVKSMNKKKAFMEQKNNLTVNPDKNLQNKEEVKNRIAELWSTLDEAIDYLKNNIDNKDKKEEISVLIDDCINALNSIENASTEIKDEKDVTNEIKNIKELKSNFNDLKQAFQNGNLDKCKDILNQK